MPDETTPTLDRILESLLEGMRDGRIADAVRRDLLDDLRQHVEDGFFDDFGARLTDENASFQGFPDEVETTEQALAWILAEDADQRDRAVSVVALRIGSFLRAQRPRILASVEAAGEGPGPDRDARVAEAMAALDTVRRSAGLDAPPVKADARQAQEELDPLIEAIEPVRETLADVVLDDQLVGYPSEALPERPDAPPAARLLREAWLLEADLWVRAAERVGPPLPEGAAGTYEQHPFLLDAIVAVQEALTLESRPSDLLRLAALRHAKGDVGEARVICERVQTTTDDPAVLARAEALVERISASSPLGNDRRCFVATAAMGDADAFEVVQLRAWRDRVLVPSAVGRLVVAAYYRVSPPAARWIARHPHVRRVVRAWVIRPLADVLR
jgi:hypothetical protein